jgi:hypothetical protein
LTETITRVAIFHRSVNRFIHKQMTAGGGCTHILKGGIIFLLYATTFSCSKLVQ